MALTFIRGLHNLHRLQGDVVRHGGVVATIGSFDGVHIGHQAVLAQVRERAVALGLPSMVMVFEPQPYEFFSGEHAPARLMRLRDKVQAIVHSGIERVFCLQFNQRLRSLSAQDFIDDVLVRGIDVKSLIVGDDFRFGCDRRGDYALLCAAGEQHGFEVVRNATVEVGGERVSSTRIRCALEASDFVLAERLLGKPYAMHGCVAYGQQLGRTIGVPTANVHLRRYRSPLAGVFAVDVTVCGQRLQGVANVGVRPTVGGLPKPILEVHLLDFSGDLYGQQMSVVFRHRLRDEQKFASLDALREQILADIDQARAWFYQHK